ncbi:tyrosine-type recombinase/integrase [Phenylobacterium montanum]|uniref:Tyrosine-type recombinase/integrase n=1 Tax=Phenylobacterium montanum TaxID=2823693 RepID=A0A975IYL7_9CAUL|nr:tyrosine-type recombinase/integrase [Caulobacter sp. S6]QUD90586.1 tyrosine-type recombinase/integrase [Caulobacter sp. S6]
MTKRLAKGRFAIYWYVTRGGPLITKFEGENRGAALKAEAEKAGELAALYAEARKPKPPSGQTLRGLIYKYKIAADGFGRLAESTKKHWRRSLDVIDGEFGDLPIKLLEAKSIRVDIVEWRNRRKNTPRQADYDLTVLQRLLSWAKKTGLIEVNPAEGIDHIHRSNRADQIVESHELDAILATTTPRAALAIRLAAATGLRREDLVNMKWEHVKDSYITFPTGKSRGRKVVTVPIYGDGRAVIDTLKAEREALIKAGKVPSAYVLTTELGKPWRPDSVTQAFVREAKKLKIAKRLNDLRGTAITRFVIAGLTDEQVADIVGWELNRVRNIRKHYVDANKIALGIITKLENAERTG